MVNFFLVSLNFIRLDISQIEVTRRFLVRNSFKNSFSLFNIKPFFYFTKKSKKSRMGKGVGIVNSKEFILKPGFKVFEFSSLDFKKSKNIIYSSLKKLPGKYKLFLK